jgi:hypothetical protein
LEASDFEIKVDADKRRYVVKVKSEQTKNHTGTTNENEGDGGRMYETGGIMCSVISFEKYLSKRNKKSGALFQYPKSTFTDDEKEWYENRAMGKNAIGNFMSVLSKKANLSEEYTNHCIRATTITELERYGFKDGGILSVSGHRNTAALKSYTSDSSVEVKCQMSDTLSSLTHENMSVVPVSMNVCPQSVQNFHQIPTVGPLLPYTTTSSLSLPAVGPLIPYTPTSSLSLPAVGPSLSNSTTTLSDIDVWDIDDNLLLETLTQIEKQPLQTQSNNQFIQHENVMSNNTPSFKFNNCTVTINYAGK